MSAFGTPEWLASAQQVKEWIKSAAGATNTLKPKVLVGIKSLGGSPTAIHCTPQGHLWTIVHTHTLVKLSSAGQALQRIGSVGRPGFVDGPLSLVQFNFGFWLAGLCEDHSGSLHFTDPGNHAIRSLSTDETQVITQAGFTGQAGRVDGPKADARFNHPTSLVISASGAFFISDTGNSCIRVLLNGQVNTITGGESQVTSTDLFSPALAPLGVAAGLAYTQKGQLLVADAGNHSIRRITQDRVSTIAGTCPGLLDGPAETALFSNPTGLTLTPAGDLLVCDLGNNAIRAVGDGSVSTLFSHSTSPLASNCHPVLSSFTPCGITLGLNSRLYVAEIQGIVVLAEENTLKTLSGSPITWSESRSRPSSPPPSPRHTPPPQQPTRSGSSQFAFTVTQTNLAAPSNLPNSSNSVLSPQPNTRTWQTSAAPSNSSAASILQQNSFNPAPSVHVTWRLQGKFEFGLKEMVPCITAVPLPTTDNLVLVRAALLQLVKRATLLFVKASSFVSNELFDCDAEISALVAQTTQLIEELSTIALNTPVPAIKFTQLLDALKDNVIAYDSLITTSIGLLFGSSDSD